MSPFVSLNYAVLPSHLPLSPRTVPPFHSRRDISTIHSASSTSNNPMRFLYHPEWRYHSRYFSFKIERTRARGKQEGEPPLRPSDPSPLSYKFNVPSSLSATSVSLRFPPSLLHVAKGNLRCISERGRVCLLALWKNIRPSTESAR